MTNQPDKNQLISQITPLSAGDLCINKIKYRSDILDSVVKIYENNTHQTTAATKTRSEVSGGGRKPWRQKGTGRARAGSTRSPLWRGGGITFGPKPIKPTRSLNQKVKKLAFQLALLEKVNAGQLLLMPDLPETLKLFNQQFPNPIKNALLIIDKGEKDQALKIGNHPEIKIIIYPNLNPYLIHSHRLIILTGRALKAYQQ